MVPPSRRLPFSLPTVGDSPTRSLCLPNQHQVPPVLHKSRQGYRIPGRCSNDGLVGRPALPLPSDSAPAQDNSQTPLRQRGCHSSRPLVATPTMVRQSSSHGVELPPPSAHPGLALAKPDSSSPPGPSHTTSDGVEDFPSIEDIILAARKPSTRTLYLHKWKVFLRFAATHNLPTSPTTLQALLMFLHYLSSSGLALSTLRVYVAAIVSHQPVGSTASRLFQHSTLKAFLKGLRNLRPPVTLPTPQWSLYLVLNTLTKPPFEPMATTSQWLLTLKTCFLIAITSARRASELAALRVDPPYLQFHPNKVTLFPDISFLPKVVSEFHINQPIVLPTFFPAPSSDLERTMHMLDVRRALAFYVSRSASLRKTQRLFILVQGPNAGNQASSQAISKWIKHLIRLAYEIAKTPLPPFVRSHSTRAMATSTAFMKGASIPDICKAATWSSHSTFARHYRMDTRARNDSSFGRSVLQSVLQ